MNIPDPSSDTVWGWLGVIIAAPFIAAWRLIVWRHGSITRQLNELTISQIDAHARLAALDARTARIEGMLYSVFDRRGGEPWDGIDRREQKQGGLQ